MVPLFPYYQNSIIEAGIDEVGRGSLAGPVVAAAVIFPKDYFNSSIKDSKKLSKGKRETLKKEIEKNAISFAIAEASNKEIDKINILNASFLAMHRCVDKLFIKPEFLLIDGNRFKPYPGISHQCFIKGDNKYLAIAAASILAKTYRDELMQKLSMEFPEYQWYNNAGYPTYSHKQALLKFGCTPWHRLSFKNVS